MRVEAFATVVAGVLLLALVVSPAVLASGGMGSEDARIPFSAIAGGSATMGSEHYGMRGTVGQSLIAVSSSSSYGLSAGFWPCTLGYLGPGTVRVYVPLILRDH